MKILVFQHHVTEHPGSFRELLKGDGHTLETIELDKGDEIPPLDNFDALWVMGGPMDVWQEEAHPWLVSEKATIRTAVVEKGMPFLGICLGHQLLADALGGQVGRSEKPEIGVMDVELTAEGRESPFFRGVRPVIKCLQWHSAEVSGLPDCCKVLASSPACAVNAMSYGDHALTLQFHVEVEANTVDDWSLIPEYASALRTALGPDGPDLLDSQCQLYRAEFAEVTRLVYGNWFKP